MKERPILFSGPMVMAILEGRKMQTRRVIKPQPNDPDNKFRMDMPTYCPYGKPGDRLWVCESLTLPDGDHWLYSADNQPVMVNPEHETAMVVWVHHKDGDHRPSIHMSRWASRITLEISDVRVERVQDISNKDAREEGLDCAPHRGATCGRADTGIDQCAICPFVMLWQSINGKTHPWSSNPWVWVVEFKRV
jgi:hypothetical protein